jgi:hypothetical protein
VEDTAFIKAESLLLPVLVFILVLHPILVVSASNELLQNGDFETGKLDEWSARNSKAIRDSTNTPAHSGKYSVRLGTTTKDGELSQTVQIPAKSSAIFTAWYRVEKGSTLGIFLKRSDGTGIKDWSVTSVSSWTSVRYDLDVSYAGQSIIVDFVGVGSKETTTNTYLEYYCDPFYGCNWFPVTYQTSNDYYVYVDDISMTHAIAIYEASVSIDGLPQDLSANLSVDGKQKDTIAGGQSLTLTFGIDETHTISVDTYVSKNENTRYYCASSSATVRSDSSTTFSYRPQYYLSVDSQYGNTAGTGWYDENSRAQFSVDRGTYPMTGLVGNLGAKNVFQGWAGDSSDTSLNAEIDMNGPKLIHAVWRPDYTVFYLMVGAIVGVSVGAILATYWVVSRRKRPLKLPSESGVEIPKVGAESKKAELEVPSPSAEEQEILTLMERLEKSHQDGRVAENVYQKLREDYESRLAEVRSRKAK